eukprot:949650-Amphidinium_carterae.1
MVGNIFWFLAKDYYVAPAATRFLFIIGVLHVYELLADLVVSWTHVEEHRLELYEVQRPSATNCMSSCEMSKQQ